MIIEISIYLGSSVHTGSEVLKCEKEIKTRISIPKEAFTKKNIFCESNRLVKCLEWTKVLYGDGTWTLRKSDKMILLKWRHEEDWEISAEYRIRKCGR